MVLLAPPNCLSEAEAGATVEFQWLEGRASLNGKTAVVECYLQERGRYNVKIAETGELIAVKPGNIKTIAPYTHHYLLKQQEDLKKQQEIWASVGAGDWVTVKSQLSTDSKEPITLAKGTRGTVIRMDKDGDAIIKFDGHNTRHWIYKEKFSMLSVTIKADEKSSPQKSPLKPRAANTQSADPSTAGVKTTKSAKNNGKNNGTKLRVVL